LPEVIVLGAQGVLGTFVARALTDAGHRVIRSGRRPEGAPDFRHVDLRDPASVAAACTGADLVVSCVRDTQLTAERHVLANGGRLLSVANLDMDERRRLESTPGHGLVVLHAGLTPGVNSLSAGDLLATHPEADEVRLVMTFSVNESGGPQAVGDFAHALATRRSRHPTADFDLCGSYGRRRCPQVGGAETGVLGSAPADRRAAVFFCFHERWFHQALLLLNAFGLMRLLPRVLFTAGLKVPDELTTEPKCDRVEIRAHGELIAARFTQGTGDYRLTVAATVAFAEAVLALDDPPAGAVGVDELFTFAELRERFEERGFDFVDLGERTLEFSPQ